MRSLGQIVILLGPPGSGKGTQGARLAAQVGIPEISTGEMLRKECQTGSTLGRAIERLLSAGQLVPDELVNRVVANRLRRRDCRKGCILDGYPRTVAQARFLDSILAKLNMASPIALDFQLDPEEIVERLSRRYHCTVCGRTYSLHHAGNGAEMICEQDGSELQRRTDDHPSTIRERLRVYEENAAEVVSYYRGRDYYRICATRAIDEISRELTGILDTALAPVLQSRTNSVPALA